MTFTIKCDPSVTAPLTKAMALLTDDDPEAVQDALDVLRDLGDQWEPLRFGYEYTHPVRPVVGEETLEDLWNLLQCVMQARGARVVTALYEAYGIVRLIELRACDYPQFAADCETAFWSVNTRFNEG